MNIHPHINGARIFSPPPPLLTDVDDEVMLTLRADDRHRAMENATAAIIRQERARSHEAEEALLADLTAIIKSNIRLRVWNFALVPTVCVLAGLVYALAIGAGVV